MPAAAAVAGKAPPARSSTLSTTRTRLFMSAPPAVAAPFPGGCGDKLPSGRRTGKARNTASVRPGPSTGLTSSAWVRKRA
ncbi:hypothetical protein GCM10010347_61090 [Streptomyces cirratus]|uniref:Uncharacterized protein n=1 Tax=Streptomyces cirratus TaxID=68187 RepID=A0ABQ3F552_9ACTN|nr:hypothetical protein GCM10010347_61090 [Streptomyces cirratus]